MFSWDETKRKEVIEAHNIDFAEIVDVFDDAFALYIEDYAHSDKAEIRFSIIGKTAAYGLVFAAYVYTNQDGIHFITARRAEHWMVKEYEKQRKRF